ncbi:MAG: energy-coupling factor transporter ATPase [Bacillota bacterium]
MTRETPLVEMRGVEYSYHRGDSREVPALRDVNLSIHRGEFVAVVGANGSGKSTLAKLMNALLLPVQGEVLVAGMPTSDPQYRWEIRRTVGMVFQNPDNQLVSTTVEEEIAFGLENLGVPTESMGARVSAMLGEVNMERQRSSEPHNLSGGQKQRVAIAAVLAMEPDCLVMDEATSMLDPGGRRDVMTTTRRLCRTHGLAVVWISHFMEEAAQADRIVVLDEGEVVADSPPRQIFTGGFDLERAGLDIPPVTQLAGRLREKGFPLPTGITEIDELVDCLCRLHSKM